MKHISLRTHEVQQILAGRQTRLSRPVKPQPEDGLHNDDQFPRSIDSRLTGWNGTVMETGESKQFQCPFGKVGEVIACKEGWCYYVNEDGYTRWDQFLYRADGEDICCLDADGFDAYNKDGTASSPWISPVTMPLPACRLFLRVKEIGVERIQDITGYDVLREGIGKLLPAARSMTQAAIDYKTEEPALIEEYKTLHQSIYGPDSWDLNLFHWVIIFEKTDKPE